MSNLVQRRSVPSVSGPGRQGRRQEPVNQLRAAWQGTIGMMLRWLGEERRRRDSIDHLQSLNERLLCDIGIDRNDIVGSVDRLLSEQRLGTGLPSGREIDRDR